MVRNDLFTIEGIAANIHDLAMSHMYARNEDAVMHGNSGYLGIDKQKAVISNKRLSMTDRRINPHPSSLKATDKYSGII